MREERMHTSEQVWGIIDNDAGLKQDLERGIINVTRLANYLQQKYQLDAGTEAIVASIRRYRRTREQQNDLLPSLRDTEVRIRRDISLLSRGIQPIQRAARAEPAMAALTARG
jgi:hypothetical protein